MKKACQVTNDTVLRISEPTLKVRENTHALNWTALLQIRQTECQAHLESQPSALELFRTTAHKQFPSLGIGAADFS
jgi:hypothetical protein